LSLKTNENNLITTYRSLKDGFLRVPLPEEEKKSILNALGALIRDFNHTTRSDLLRVLIS